MVFNQPLSQIWVADVESPEANHVGPSVLQKLQPSLMCHGVVCDINAIEVGSEEFGNNLHLLRRSLLKVDLAARPFLVCAIL